MSDIIRYDPQLIHCEFKTPMDIIGSPEQTMTIAKSIVNPITGDSVCYTMRPKVTNPLTNKSAVAERVYEIKLNSSEHTIETIHSWGENEEIWLLMQINKIIKAPILQPRYDRSKMDKIVREVFKG